MTVDRGHLNEAEADRIASEIDRKDAQLLGMQDPTIPHVDLVHEHEINV